MANESERKIIEFVCTTNVQSAIAEILARDYLCKINMLKEYDAASSGTMVSGIAQSALSSDDIRRAVNLDMDEFLYSADKRRLVEHALYNRDEVALRGHFSAIESRLLNREAERRDEALEEFGFMVLPKRTRDQTVARTDVVAVFATNMRNLDRIKTTYATIMPKPVISVLSSYANNSACSGFPETFNVQYVSDYRNNLSRMMREVPKAIDRLLGKSTP